MSDESLREFQLNGKQLVFLFMASTIVAVVIFLCGVMVGRGVSAAQAAAVTNSTVETGDPTAGATPEPPPPVPAAPVDVAPDAPGDGELRYPNELTGGRPRGDIEASPASASTRAPRPPSVVNVSAATSKPAVAAGAPRLEPSPSAPLNTEPAGTGFVVQVVATPRRAEAEAVQARLQKKGYPAFITSAGSVFRVRVGKYQDRAEANTTAKRLETEERFKPWVTR